MKVCSKCRAEKPKTEFYRCSRAKDGLRPSCNACKRAYINENKDSIAEYQRAYYSENKDSLTAKMREYSAVNADAIAENGRKYRQENQGKIAEKCQRWAAANQDKVTAKSRNRRAKIRNADGSHTAEDVKAIFESQRGLCANCTSKLIKSGKNRYHVDHIQPLSKGGSNDKYNLQCLCPECNLKKNAKDPSDWAKQNWRLL